MEKTMRNNVGRMLKTLLCGILLLGLTFTGITAIAESAAVTTIEDMTIDYQTNPFGVDTQDFDFGWKLDSTKIGVSQVQYEIVVYDASGAVVWDSGLVEGEKSVAISYEGSELALESAYTWVVSVVDNSGDTIVSEAASFETGADWGDTQWITTIDQTVFVGEEVYIEDMFESYDGIETTTSGSNAPLFRTEQELTGETVASARLYITALGVYEAYINGEAVQGDVDSMMAPGWTDYTAQVKYQTYDVTEYITGDTVTIGAIVSTGWYGSSMNTRVLYHYAIGDLTMERCLYAKLVITYENGDQQVISTNDSDWYTSDDLSPYDYSGMYEGEYFDGEKYAAIAGWTEAGYDVSEWDLAVDPETYTRTEAVEFTVDGETYVSESYTGSAYSGEILPSNVNLAYDYTTFDFIAAYTYNEETDIITAEAGSEYASGEIDMDAAVSYSVGDVIELKEGETLVLDFGQNAAAVPYLVMTGDAGTVVDIQPSEIVSDGNTFVTDRSTGDQTPYAKDVIYPAATSSRGWTYVLSGGEDTYRPEAHFCGFRYLEITAVGGDVYISTAQSIAISSLTDETGTVDTSNDVINQFISNTKWSELSNFVSIPTDCPTREYRGWQADAQVFLETAMYNFDTYAMVANYIDIMNDYFDINGTYSCLAPGSADYAHQTSRVAVWSDAPMIITYYYYIVTGDSSYIEEYWDYMADFVAQVYDNTVFEQGTDFQSGYKDYLQWGDHMALESASTNFINLTFTLYDNMLMAEMAEIIGLEEEAAAYTEAAEFVRAFMIERYIDEEGNVNCYDADSECTEGFTPMIGGDVVNNAQTAVTWALKLGVYETEEQMQYMIDTLAASVANEDNSVRAEYDENTLAVGFAGVNVLSPILSDFGASETAYDLILNTSLYTPTYSAAVGGTTTWESWDGWTEDGGYDGNSKNHFPYGSAAEWVYEYLIGIQKDYDNPAYKNVILQPEVDEGLSYANGSYESLYGTIVSSWTAEAGILLTYTAEIPANTTADLYLPVDESVTEALSVDGATFVEFTEHNGIYCAQYALVSGGYDFSVADGTVSVAIADGYVAE